MKTGFCSYSNEILERYYDMYEPQFVLL